MKRNIQSRFIIVIFLLLFIYILRVNISYPKFEKIYLKNMPNLKEKYQNIIDKYTIMDENYEFIAAEILDPTIHKLTNTFLINKGKSSNIKKDSFVVDENGLVGIVTNVYETYSKVNLITSSNVSIAVEINNCFGSLKNKYNKAVISDLINCKDVKIGDPVFTSKYNLSSSNILIGYITNIKNNKIYIKYVMNPYKVRYVGIINDNN